MFKATVLVLLLFLSSSAFAETNPILKMNVDLTLNGKHVASQGLIVKGDEKSTIQQKDKSGNSTFIEVTPSEIDGELKTIHLTFVIGKSVKGVRQILSTPEMIIEEGKVGEITIGDDRGPEGLTLTVLAKRQASVK